MMRFDLIDASYSKQRHIDGDLLLEQLEDAHQAGLTSRAQAPALEFPDGHSLTPKRQRL